MHDDKEEVLQWELRASGTFDEISDFVQEQRYYRRQFATLPEPYQLTDISPFPPSSAIYFMDGQSDATVRILSSGEQITYNFADANTSIAATAPLLYDREVLSKGLHLDAPEPLRPIARFPESLPERYRRDTSLHLLQVISMNMRGVDSRARLLIGLPYAEEYPELFFKAGLLDADAQDASSFGAVSSLTDFVNPLTGRRETGSNGYPARSAFAVYHILETEMGSFFNKKPTVMELQPDRNGKLALTLPPIPFNYELINGPIPLYDVKRPDGPPLAEIILAHHPASSASRAANSQAWPWHLPDLAKIQRRLRPRK